jgi:hypothetical protein
VRLSANRFLSFRAMSTETLLRRGLVGLAALSSAATVTELVLLQHWGKLLELIPWSALILLVVAIALVARPSRRNVLTARVLGVVVLGIASVGVVIHVWSNYDAGPLDAQYMYEWPTLSEPVRWLLAATSTVGPSPTLAPMALAFSSLCLLLATARHPVLYRTAVAERSGPVPEEGPQLSQLPEGVAKSGEVSV